MSSSAGILTTSGVLGIFSSMYRTPAILRLSVRRAEKPEPATAPQSPPEPEAVEPPVAECAAFIRLCRDHLVPLVDNAPGVTRKELRILKDLRSERGDIAAAVARRLGIDDGEMSRLVKRLAARELLMRMPADSPRRSALRLTPTGRALVDRSTWADHVMLEARLEELTAAEQESLRRAMAVVSELLCETELD